MMTLTTISKQLNLSTSRVYWRVGTQRRGILDVQLDFEHDDIELLAELAALRYLLFERQVFNRAPGSGLGYRLVVSKGAIRKLALGRSSKRHAQKYAAFLTSRMKGVTIEVSQSMEHMPDVSEEAPELLHADRKEYAATHDAIDTPAMGTVYLTAHAVEQYTKRISTGDPKRPWASLVGRLQHPDLQLLPLPERVLRHKARRYGTADNVEAWGHQDSKFTYLVINNNGQRTVVTVFERRGG